MAFLTSLIQFWTETHGSHLFQRGSLHHVSLLGNLVLGRIFFCACLVTAAASSNQSTVCVTTHEVKLKPPTAGEHPRLPLLMRSCTAKGRRHKGLDPDKIDSPDPLFFRNRHPDSISGRYDYVRNRWKMIVYNYIAGKSRFFSIIY